MKPACRQGRDRSRGFLINRTRYLYFPLELQVDGGIASQDLLAPCLNRLNVNEKVTSAGVQKIPINLNLPGAPAFMFRVLIRSAALTGTQLFEILVSDIRPRKLPNLTLKCMFQTSNAIIQMANSARVGARRRYCTTLKFSLPIVHHFLRLLGGTDGTQWSLTQIMAPLAMLSLWQADARPIIAA